MAGVVIGYYPAAAYSTDMAAQDIQELNQMIADFIKRAWNADSLESAREYLNKPDPDGYRRATVLPYATNAEGETEWAVPAMGREIAREGLSGLEAPVRVLKGEVTPEQGAFDAALATMGAGLVGGRYVPRGALTANVFKFREGPAVKIGDDTHPSLLTSDGEVPESLYRVVSRKEFDKAQESGKYAPGSFYERIHASSSPDMRYKNAPDDVVIKIKYDPDDGWHSKRSLDEVYGVTRKDIPISRTSEVRAQSPHPSKKDISIPQKPPIMRLRGSTRNSDPDQMGYAETRKSGTAVDRQVLKKDDSMSVPPIDNPSLKLEEFDAGMGFHQLSTPDNSVNLIGGTPVRGSSDYSVLHYGVADESGKNLVGNVKLRRDATTGQINGIVDIEIKPEYRKQGYAKKILEALRASTEGADLNIFDIQNTKYFNKYAKTLPSYKIKQFEKGGSVVERNPYNYEPKAI